MARKEQQNGQTEQPSSSSGTDQSAVTSSIGLPATQAPQREAIEPEPSTAITSPTEAEEAEALDILSDLVMDSLPEQIASQLVLPVWAAIAKKLRAQRAAQTSYPQFSPSASPDGLRLATSSSAEPLPPPPPDANS